MQFFTLDRENTLKAGTTLILSESDNIYPYYSTIGLSSSTELQDHATELFPNGLSKFGWRYIKNRHTYGDNVNGFQHDISTLMEMNVEYVRRFAFSNLPSRLTAMFACENIEQARHLKVSWGCPDARIYMLEADIFYKADMHWLFLGTQNVQGSFLAHKYWSGAASNNPFWEYILPLPVKVIEEIN
jgi:hypothetical protein